MPVSIFGNAVSGGEKDDRSQTLPFFFSAKIYFISRQELPHDLLNAIFSDLQLIALP
jgi:hypothetical protein